VDSLLQRYVYLSVAGHTKHRSSIVARARFRGNVFTELLPSNELFLLSGVMSQYEWMKTMSEIIVVIRVKVKSKYLDMCRKLEHRK
jgi:hypothetical protein